MKCCWCKWNSIFFLPLLLLQTILSFSAAPSPVTVPAVVDHNRVTINVDVPMPDGTAQTIRAWVNTGSTDLTISRRLATLLGLEVSCSETACSSSPPARVSIQGLTIPLTDFKQAHIPLKPVSAASVIAAGMRAEITLPATILRHYDVLIDFPGQRFSIGPPGSIQFKGSSCKVIVNSENGLILVPSKIEEKKYNLALDAGASISLLSGELFDQLSAAHRDWPRMTGAVSSANIWGEADEANSRILRVDRIQFGPLFLTDVPVVSKATGTAGSLQSHAGVPTAGLIGSDALLNYRVGFDFVHATVYFDIGRLLNFPEFDVVGLTLRPEDDGRFTILGTVRREEDRGQPAGNQSAANGDTLVAVDGIPVQGSTMGQVWSMLRGNPGQERQLTIERAGKQMSVTGTIRHFLPSVPDIKDFRKRR